MGGKVKYRDLTHDCTLPDTGHLPSSGERYQRLLTWRCPACGQRWSYEARFMDYDRFGWERIGGPGWCWRRAEAKRLTRRAEAGDQLHA